MAEQFKVSYTDPQGVVWPLWEPGVTNRVFMVANTLEGLVGGVTDVATVAPRVPGQSLGYQTIPPMAGGFTVAIPGGRAAYIRWRAAWSTWRAGVLTIERPGAVRTTRVRLAEVPPSPGADFDAHDLIQLPMRLVSDEGCWAGEGVSDTGIVGFTNDGDCDAYPVLSWNGAGGEVTLPSGATFTLPTADGPRTLDLNPAKAAHIVGTHGVVDMEATEQLGYIYPEATPAGARRVYTAPQGVTVTLTPRYLDPWR